MKVVLIALFCSFIFGTDSHKNKVRRWQDGGSFDNSGGGHAQLGYGAGSNNLNTYGDGSDVNAYGGNMNGYETGSDGTGYDSGGGGGGHGDASDYGQGGNVNAYGQGQDMTGYGGNNGMAEFVGGDSGYPGNDVNSYGGYTSNDLTGFDGGNFGGNVGHGGAHAEAYSHNPWDTGHRQVKTVVRHTVKNIAVPHPVPAPVHIPIPKYISYFKPFPVAKPVAVPEVIPVVKHIQKPIAFFTSFPVARSVPVPKFIGLPVQVRVPRPVLIRVPKVVPVAKKFAVPITVHVPKPYVVPIYQQVPVPVPHKVPKIINIVKEIPHIVKKPVPIYIDEHGRTELAPASAMNHYVGNGGFGSQSQDNFNSYNNFDSDEEYNDGYEQDYDIQPPQSPGYSNSFGETYNQYQKYPQQSSAHTKPRAHRLPQNPQQYPSTTSTKSSSIESPRQSLDTSGKDDKSPDSPSAYELGLDIIKNGQTSISSSSSSSSTSSSMSADTQQIPQYQPNHQPISSGTSSSTSSQSYSQNPLITFAKDLQNMASMYAKSFPLNSNIMNGQPSQYSFEYHNPNTGSTASQFFNSGSNLDAGNFGNFAEQFSQSFGENKGIFSNAYGNGNAFSNIKNNNNANNHGNIQGQYASNNQGNIQGHYTSNNQGNNQRHYTSNNQVNNQGNNQGQYLGNNQGQYLGNNQGQYLGNNQGLMYGKNPLAVTNQLNKQMFFNGNKNTFASNNYGNMGNPQTLKSYNQKQVKQQMPSNFEFGNSYTDLNTALMNSKPHASEMFHGQGYSPFHQTSQLESRNPTTTRLQNLGDNFGSHHFQGFKTNNKATRLNANHKLSNAFVNAESSAYASPNLNYYESIFNNHYDSNGQPLHNYKVEANHGAQNVAQQGYETMFNNNPNINTGNNNNNNIVNTGYKNIKPYESSNSFGNENYFNNYQNSPEASSKQPFFTNNGMIYGSEQAKNSIINQNDAYQPAAIDTHSHTYSGSHSTSHTSSITDSGPSHDDTFISNDDAQPLHNHKVATNHDAQNLAPQGYLENHKNLEQALSTNADSLPSDSQDNQASSSHSHALSSVQNSVFGPNSARDSSAAAFQSVTYSDATDETYQSASRFDEIISSANSQNQPPSKSETSANEIAKFYSEPDPLADYIASISNSDESVAPKQVFSPSDLVNHKNHFKFKQDSTEKKIHMNPWNTTHTSMSIVSQVPSPSKSSPTYWSPPLSVSPNPILDSSTGFSSQDMKVVSGPDSVEKKELAVSSGQASPIYKPATDAPEYKTSISVAYQVAEDLPSKMDR